MGSHPQGTRHSGAKGGLCAGAPLPAPSCPRLQPGGRRSGDGARSPGIPVPEARGAWRLSFVFILNFYFFLIAVSFLLFPSWLSGREATCSWKRGGFDPWVRRISWRRKWQPTHSSTLAWKIPWMEEPDGLQSMGSQRVGHD